MLNAEATGMQKGFARPGYFFLDASGVIRSEIFPGLWLPVDALLRLDYPALLPVLQQGLASPEHQAFVAALAARRQGGQP